MNKILILCLSLTPLAWGMSGGASRGSAEKTAVNPRTRSFYSREYVLMRDTVGVASQDGAQGSEQAALVQINSSGAPTPQAMATFSNLADLSVGALSNDSTVLGAALKALLSLRLSGLSMGSLPNLSSLVHLQELDLSDNGLTLITHLPPNLQVLRAARNELTRLPNSMPATLKELDVQGNDIDVLEAYELPANLEKLNIAGNNLSYIFRLPPKIQKCDASYNQLQELPNLAHGRRYLCQLNLRGNCIKTLPIEFVCAIARNPQLLLDLRANPLAAECAAKLLAAGYNRGEEVCQYTTPRLLYGQYTFEHKKPRFERGKQVVLVSGEDASDKMLDYVTQCTLKNVNRDAVLAVLGACNVMNSLIVGSHELNQSIWLSINKDSHNVVMRGNGPSLQYCILWK